MQVEIWSDVVCPWCYIGKRRFEAALARFDHADEVEVVWRSFELDPSAPREDDVDATQHLAEKYGTSLAAARKMHERMAEAAAGEGLEMRFEVARRGNTFDAHRLLHLAADRGVQGQVKDRLMRAYFTEGEPVGRPEALVRVTAEAGLDAEEARQVLAGDAYTDAVRADQREAQQLGISSVPFFAIDRTFGIAGAQPADDLVEALDKAWADSHPMATVAE